MVWRLEHMTRLGIEGTVLGTLVMPYCSGIGNLIFVFVAAREHLPGSEVITNCVVNNVTNMTLLIGLPAVIWVAHRPPGNGSAKPNRKRKEAQEQRLNRLSMLLTLFAVLFFTGAAWALGTDGVISRSDGLVLVGLFLFWQCFHVFDVLKTNVRERRSLSGWLILDLSLLLFGAFDIYLSVQGLVTWISQIPKGFLSIQQAGWLSGWLMVLPNALLALYYGWQRKPEVIYTSQIGDGHICIPLCIGLAALLQPLKTPAFFQTGVLILLGAVGLHLLFVGVLGRLPRFVGLLLTAVYGYFVYAGLLA